MNTIEDRIRAAMDEGLCVTSVSDEAATGL